MINTKRKISSPIAITLLLFISSFSVLSYFTSKAQDVADSWERMSADSSMVAQMKVNQRKKKNLKQQPAETEQIKSSENLDIESSDYPQE